METNRAVILVAIGAIVAAVAAVVTAAVVFVSPKGSAATPLNAIGVSAPAASDTITVVGQGTGTSVPDEAHITLGVAPSRNSAADAVNTAASEMGRLLDTLHQQGVQDGDIQTTSINVTQEGGCCPRYVTGYTAETDVTVLIRHLNNVGTVIAAVTQAIGNDSRINGVSLSVSDPSAAVKSARAAAMKDAAARAAEWAALANRKVGRILGVSEVVTAPNGTPCTSGCGGGGVPVSAGQTSVLMTVTVIYQLTG
jgi:uncharacterized protein YggE